MTLDPVNLARWCSLACFAALACGPAIDSGDSDTEAATSTQGTSTGEASSTAASSTASSATTIASSGSESSTTSADDTSVDPTTAESSSTGGVVVACDPFPFEDTACTVEGQSCSTDCSDQCQFCNVMTCENGIWTRLEVFPAPCLDCEPLCDLVVPAACAGGPPNLETCIAGCEQAIEGECAAEFSNTRACAGTEPAFICSDETRPEVAGCETEYDALYACMGI